MNDWNKIIPKGKSYFYYLKNNAVPAVHTGSYHWIEFLPDHVYCFVPSMEINAGNVIIQNTMPEFLKDFLFCKEIKKVILIQNFSLNLTKYIILDYQTTYKLS